MLIFEGRLPKPITLEDLSRCSATCSSVDPRRISAFLRVRPLTRFWLLLVGSAGHRALGPSDPRFLIAPDSRSEKSAERRTRPRICTARELRRAQGLSRKSRGPPKNLDGLLDQMGERLAAQPSLDRGCEAAGLNINAITMELAGRTCSRNGRRRKACP